MDIKPIKTEQDYQNALAEIDRLFDADPGTPEGDRVEVLVTLVEAYEKEYYALPLPDPIDAIEFHLERLGLTRHELEPLIGTRARVSEILNRRRPLTMRMIRNIHDGLGISYEVLMQRHPLEGEEGDNPITEAMVYPPSTRHHPHRRSDSPHLR
jgi:HTH-type transcriptional regulator / antitoxin HigA